MRTQMARKFLFTVLFLVTLQLAVAPPVDQKKEPEKKESEELDDYGLEYGRYLQQVVQALEEDKEFAKKLENVSSEQIKSGHIAKELEFVKHNVRSKLDELKRIEVDRLRKLIQRQMEQTELGLYRDEDGHLLNSPDGRRWRTLPDSRGGKEGLNRSKGVKIPMHLDVENPHSFEIEDLKKLIQTATNDLEEVDRQRREEFKKYELEKEATYREGLNNMTDDQRKEAEQHHKEVEEKHKDHPKIHHPGSKPQLEQVWEERDHMRKDEFNPKTFFAMHDVNGDGHLDVEEVEALLIPEIRKMYKVDDPENQQEVDQMEMQEEFHRMREHIFNETDSNRDALISLEEFIKMTEQQDFSKDEGWKGLDEEQIFSEAELQEYMRQREMHYGEDPRGYYDVGNAHGAPPHNINQGGMPPHQGYPQGQQYGAPMQGYPNPQYQANPQQFQQGHPQQYQQHPPQFQQGHQQGQQQFQQAYQQAQQGQQQFQQGHPQGQQQFQQGHPQGQQQFQQAHQGQQQVQPQFQQGHPQGQQQFQQGHPQGQQQFQQGHPQGQQQFQQGHPQGQQQFQQGHQQPQQVLQKPPQGQQQAQPQNVNPEQGQQNQPSDNVQQPKVPVPQSTGSTNTDQIKSNQIPNEVKPQVASIQGNPQVQQVPSNS